MTLVVAVIIIALLARVQAIRQVVPSESLVVGSMVTVAIVALFQTGRLG